MTDSALATASDKDAQIIQFPRGAAERVIQIKKRGRHPKSISLLWHAQRDRKLIEVEKQEITEEIGRVKLQLVMTDKMKTAWVKRLAILSRPNMSPIERSKLVAEIQWDRLPWQEKERIAREAVRTNL